MVMVVVEVVVVVVVAEVWTARLTAKKVQFARHHNFIGVKDPNCHPILVLVVVMVAVVLVVVVVVVVVRIANKPSS
jgi:hypothetical protein